MDGSGDTVSWTQNHVEEKTISGSAAGETRPAFLRHRPRVEIIDLGFIRFLQRTSRSQVRIPADQGTLPVDGLDQSFPRSRIVLHTSEQGRLPCNGDCKMARNCWSDL